MINDNGCFLLKYVGALLPCMLAYFVVLVMFMSASMDLRWVCKSYGLFVLFE